MRTFFQSILGSCLGVILAVFLVVLIGVGLATTLYSSDKDKPKIQTNTVLTLDLGAIVPEKTNNTDEQDLEQMLNQEEILGIHDYAKLIEKASSDKDIKGIYLNFNHLNIGLTKREILEDALITFKNSGKFIFAYSEYYSPSAYHLATNADVIALFPQGGIDLRGLASVVPYFKDLSDKIGIEFETYYAGKFKSATEPFRRNDMSEENRLQTRSYLKSIFNIFLDDIESNRAIDSVTLQGLLNEYVGRSAQLSLENRLIDKICYEDEMLDLIKEKLGLEVDEEINMKSLNEYHKARPLSNDYSQKEKIAVIYAEGEIHNGEERYGSISGSAYVKMLRDIREDDNIKAVVLRIDSPGGSALASEKIWRELQLIQESGKPVVASMGTYAASGGYYLATGSEYIISEPSTITGSIGVFFVLMKMNELMNEKLGINVDTVTTNQFSGAFNPFFPSTDKEKTILQSQVEEIYQTFLQRVAEARNMTIEEVHEIAQGRVWTGEQALGNGLVDELGDLEIAINKAATLANIDAYRILEYPKNKDPLQKFLEELIGEDFNATVKVLKRDVSGLLQNQVVEQLQYWKEPQARLPLTFIWN